MDETIRNYLAEIGRKGGQRSRRTLKPQTARDMVRIREARRAYRDFHATCFWSYRPNLQVGLADVEWVARTLLRYGNREAWQRAQRLCR